MLVCLTASCGNKDAGFSQTSGDGFSELQAETGSEDTGTIYAYICGAVKHPGVYPLPEGSRVYELAEKAGGMTKKADGTAVNLAEELTDGQKIEIPSINSEKAGSNTEASGSSEGLVNLNTASAQDLMALSGIGQSKADGIIAYRTEHGSFQKTSDIMKVDGIKEGTYNKIKNEITV